MHGPLEFVLCDEICAIQLFGRNRLECIARGSVIIAEQASTYARMIEIVWREKRYLVFERDLEERAQHPTFIRRSGLLEIECHAA